jgi:hypothetical protein
VKATIHQPDFMPWFGFFNKIAKCDTWVVLDHVENNPRDAAFWGRRVRILVNGQPTWLSIPLSRPDVHGVIGVPIRDMTINLREPKALQKCLRTVQMAYAAAPYFERHRDLVESYFADEDPALMGRNMRFIEAVLDRLGLRPRVIASSSLGVTSRGTRLLVDILHAIGADTYLCGGGAGGYQQDEMFAAAGIALQYNRFEHPVYRQLRTELFVPGLSIIDALFCVPTDRLAGWVRTS